MGEPNIFFFFLNSGVAVVPLGWIHQMHIPFEGNCFFPIQDQDRFTVFLFPLSLSPTLMVGGSIGSSHLLPWTLLFPVLSFETDASVNGRDLQVLSGLQVQG